MRDIKRLDSFYEKLKKIHQELPDWRFAQLICNFADWYGGDIFYMEEDRFLNLLEQYINSLKGEQKMFEWIDMLIGFGVGFLFGFIAAMITMVAVVCMAKFRKEE